MARLPGPHPKPTELKRRMGNPGHRRLPAPIVALAPVVIHAETVYPQTGDQLVAALLGTAASAWIAEPDRLGLLTLLRELWDDREDLQADIARNGRSYVSEGRGGTQYHDRPEVRQLEHVRKQILECLDRLGLSPVMRSKLGVAEVREKSRLESLLERHERHRA